MERLNRPARASDPALDIAHFLSRLSLAEQRIAEGKLDADFLGLAQELGDLAVASVAPVLDRDPVLRGRWDWVWLHTDEELLRLKKETR